MRSKTEGKRQKYEYLHTYLHVIYKVELKRMRWILLAERILKNGTAD